jgi:hypothetical protein
MLHIEAHIKATAVMEKNGAQNERASEPMLVGRDRLCAEFIQFTVFMYSLHACTFLSELRL